MEKGQRERETQNPKQAPGSELSAQSPMRGSNPQTVVRAALRREGRGGTERGKHQGAYMGKMNLCNRWP